MTRLHKLTVAVLSGLAALATSTATAGALTGYTNICPSLQAAICKGALVESRGLAVDNSTGSSAGDVWGDSYAAPAALEKREKVHPMLYKFDASGSLLLEVSEDAGDGNLAVDSNTGDVYLAAGGSVTKFDSAGVVQSQMTGSETPQGSFQASAVAVDPVTGDLYVGDRAHEAIDKFTSSGTYAEQLPISASAIAVDAQGDLYVTAADGVREYSATGAPVDCPGGSNVVYEGPGSGVAAVDLSDGDIFIAESNAEGNYIAEYAGPCTAPVLKFGIGEIKTPGGISVDSRTHEVYVNNQAGYLIPEIGGTESVFIFSPVTVPDVTAGAPAGSITRSSATVSGTIEPDGTVVTVCEFEYGPTPAYGFSTPCSQELPLEGSGSNPVSAELKGIQEPPGSQVYYRLRAGNAQGSNTGASGSFYLESFLAPVVEGRPASDVSQFAATLNGTLETDEALVDYHFEYGTTAAYGSIAPIPDNYAPITTETAPISQDVNGLQAGTTYHYRLVASSPGATNVAGPDETFTTAPIPAPSVETDGASGVGVGAATLNGAIDPRGWDTTYLFQYGTSTAYGSSWPTVQVDMGALEGPQPVEVNLPSLLPNTTYHYRLIATNGGGTTYGQDMTFTTGEYPAQIIREPVSLRTLLVPSGKESAVAKKSKKGTKRKKGKARHRTKRSKAKKKTRKR